MARIDSSGRYQTCGGSYWWHCVPGTTAPAVPTGVLPLAEARVRSAGGIVISDIREYTAAAGGVIPIVGTKRTVWIRIETGHTDLCH